MVFSGDVTDEVQKAAELNKKAKEMLMKEEAEAKMKEQRRLEELAKVEVAREKKERETEKVQTRAELKARKEAEEKEKKRLKRLKEERKKEKKAAAMDVDDINNCKTVPSAAEVSKNIENDDLSSVIPKNPQKPQASMKIYRQWMRTGLISLVVYILIWLGNVDVLSKPRVVWGILQWLFV